MPTISGGVSTTAVATTGGTILPMPVSNVGVGQYCTVATGQTTALLGSANNATGGAKGDFMGFVTVTPTSTSPGAVAIKDGSNTAVTMFAGGATSLSNLTPFTFYVNAFSLQGAWQITTGTLLSVLVQGAFT